MPTTHKYRLLLLFTLLFASAASVAMIFIRFLYSGRLAYTFIPWNLFLAWLPLFFALLAFRYSHRPLFVLACGAAWLLFLPNAPYLITDLIHLSPRHNVPLWYDLITLFTAAITGLFLGFTSLYLMQKLVTRLLGAGASWLFVIASLALSSFGIYLGRFLRWNSWDIIFNPIHIGRDLLALATDPHLRLQTFAVTVGYMVLFIFAYIILFSLPRIATDP